MATIRDKELEFRVENDKNNLSHKIQQKNKPLATLI
jgi:hypothetical protein